MSSAEVTGLGAPIPAPHLSALRLVCERLEEEPPVWVVTGSLAFALRGIDVVVHDIDLQSDRTGAYEIERRLGEFVVEPVRFSEAATIRSHFGALRICGVRVEIMGDIEKRAVGSAWEPPVDLTGPRRRIAAYGLRVPLLSLEHEYRAYGDLGRTERADMLKQWMERESGGRQNKSINPTDYRPES
jgi:hypothetical protein